MEENLRRQLQELSDHLNDQDSEQARQLQTHVQGALDTGEHHGLVERLTEAETYFEAGHPKLADIIRRVADALSAAGL
jgi:hypothetical protein